MVIEAAAADSSFYIARRALSKGCNIMIMSVGGVLRHIERLQNLARLNQVNIYIPSGAIGGIDALMAARESRIRKVTLVSLKNPKSFEGLDYIRRRGIILSKIKKDTCLFSGSASRAIRLFPQNVNVAATLSIAGIGDIKTRVKVLACPGIERNKHQIFIESDACKISVSTENFVHPRNPKTSLLAVLSAIATLKRIFEAVRLGT